MQKNSAKEETYIPFRSIGELVGSLFVTEGVVIVFIT